LAGQMQMKMGDLVKVVFPYGEEAVGIFVEYEGPRCTSPFDRAQVFWDGEIYSTPLEQIEVISESR